jgi:hypothetical protein
MWSKAAWRGSVLAMESFSLFSNVAGILVSWADDWHAG